MTRSYERVYTVHEFYDRPRAGFADFDGIPHAYVSVWSDALDDWEAELVLRPISADLLAVVLEDWAIWGRWLRAFHAGETTDATHPAEPVDAARHAVLAPLIHTALTFTPADGFRAGADFKRADSDLLPIVVPSRERQLVVRWSPSGAAAGAAAAAAV